MNNDPLCISVPGNISSVILDSTVFFWLSALILVSSVCSFSFLAKWSEQRFPFQGWCLFWEEMSHSVEGVETAKPCSSLLLTGAGTCGWWGWGGIICRRWSKQRLGQGDGMRNQKFRTLWKHYRPLWELKLETLYAFLIFLVGKRL